MSIYFQAIIPKDYYDNHYSSLKFKTTMRNTIYDAFVNRGWKETEIDSEFNVFFSERNFFSTEYLQSINFYSLRTYQKVNHYPNNYELSRKDLMYKNLRKFKKQLLKEGKSEELKNFDFYPLTYYMPTEYSNLINIIKENPNKVYIMKPAGRSQGFGIFLVTNIDQIIKWKNSLKGKEDNIINELYIAQEYIMNPLLLGGRKFDMRIYALVNNFNPLSIWLCRTGFARFTHARYNNIFDDTNSNFVHLTNVAVQKTCANYNASLGGKWNLRNMKLYMYSKFGVEKVESLFSKIKNIIIKSITSVSKIIVNDKHCFEIYGYDILIKDNLEPVLIEINSNSSLTANTIEDKKLKVNMLDDVLSILDIEKLLTGTETQIGSFDLIYKSNKEINKPSYYKYNTNLGSFDNREKQMKSLAKSTYNRLKKLNEQKNLYINK